MATWVKGIDFKNSGNTAITAGVGVYGTDTVTDKLYIGLGAEPWNNTGLQVTSNSIDFKGNKIYHVGDKPTPAEIGAATSSHNHDGIYMKQANANGYWGMTANGDDANWVRTTNSGIIPYASGTASSSLGTSSWRFREAHITTIYENGTSLVSKYAPISHSHSYIPLSGSTAITGALRSSAEIQSTSANAFRAVQGNYGFFIRNDGSNTYFLLTNSGDQYGSYNSLRPLSINDSTGVVTFGNGLSGTLTGNASTATTLQNARTINGTSFNGSSNITTNSWGAVRTLTVGNAGKSVDGSANVSWSLSEIGAAATSHTHSYLPLSGGTLTSNLTFSTNNTGINMATPTGTSAAALKLNQNNTLDVGSGDSIDLVALCSKNNPAWWNGSGSYNIITSAGGTINGSTIFNNNVTINRNIRFTSGDYFGPELSTDSSRGLTIMTAEGVDVSIDARGNLGVSDISSGEIYSRKHYIKNANDSVPDSGYLSFKRANEVQAAQFTSGDSGLGLRLHLYNNSGVWATHFYFKENGWFSAPHMEIRNSYIEIGKEGDNSAWVGFHDTTKTRRGWVGKGSTGSNTIGLYADTGDILIVASTNYAYCRGHFMPDYDNTYYLGLTSPVSRRWKQLIAMTTSIATSDSRNKTNITPIVDNVSTFKDTREVKTFNVDIPKEENATKQDYYDFMKDRFNPYSFDYNISTQEEDSSMTQDDKEKLAKSIGFVADEYDLENDKVAKEFIFKTEDGMLNYNTGNYTTVIAIALQKAIEKIELLEEKIKTFEQ